MLIKSPNMSDISFQRNIYKTSKKNSRPSQKDVRDNGTNAKTTTKTLVGISSIVILSSTIFYFIKKHNMQKIPNISLNQIEELSQNSLSSSKIIQEKANEIQETGAKIYENMKTALNHALETFEAVKNKTCLGNAKIRNNILEEFDDSNQLIRRSFLNNDGSIYAIEDFKGMTSNQLLFKNNSPAKFIQSHIKLSDDTYEFEKALSFENGAISEFISHGRKIQADFNCDEKFIFKDNLLSQYYKHFTQLENGDIKSNNKYSYKNGKLFKFYSDYEKFKNGAKSFTQYFSFDNDKPINSLINVVEDGEKHLKSFQFQNNQWNSIN